jgi:hypothetical protein
LLLPEGCSPFVMMVDRVRLCDGPADGGRGTESMEKEAANGDGEAGANPDTDRAREWARFGASPGCGGTEKLRTYGDALTGGV